ncbi:MAG: hypothetical protein M3362_15945 [Acidobacteriota bacterium]|nr:hypothetical protein [Acidobacteriota bacterium]
MAMWTDDELIVLLAFYFRYPRASHTDSHADCQRLAKALKRSPGAVDNQLRNIDVDLVRSVGDRHVSRRLGELLDHHKINVPSLYREANEIIRRKKWRLPTF